MRVVVTGSAGFLGWHLRCRLQASGGYEVRALDRERFSDLEAAVADADAVVHVAGVNRATSDHEVVEGNLALAHEVAAAVVRSGGGPRLVFANSVQAGNGTSYGEAKEQASQVLTQAADAVGVPYVDVRLPNLFGEHGRPAYNSFVATFCHQVVAGEQPLVQDREVELLHAQDAAAALQGALAGPTRVDRPEGTVTRVSDVLAMLRDFDDCYAQGELPDVTSRLGRRLFSTYRTVAFEQRGPFRLDPRRDDRGCLVETVRAHGRGGQSFLSLTVPGALRGGHFHLEKLERFVVVRGRARIRLRRLFTGEVHRYDVTGDEPVAIDMPTMWAHDLMNVGDDELVTSFWTDAVFDPAAPDTYPEAVELPHTAGRLVP